MEEFGIELKRIMRVYGVSLAKTGDWDSIGHQFEDGSGLYIDVEDLIDENN